MTLKFQYKPSEQVKKDFENCFDITEPHVFKNLKESLRADKKIAMAAFRKGVSPEYVSEKLWDDRDFILSLLNTPRCPITILDCLKFASKRLRDDKEVVLKAVKIYSSNFKFASKRLRDDKEVVLEAGKDMSCFTSFKYASKRLRDDKEVVLKAVNNYPSNIRFASERLRADKEIVLIAIDDLTGDGFYGCNIEFASMELRDDKEIVMIAIENDQSCSAFSFASKRLRADKEVFLAAINAYWYPWSSRQQSILLHASSELRADKESVLAAMKNSPFNSPSVELKYINNELSNDPEFMKKVKKYFEPF